MLALQNGTYIYPTEQNISETCGIQDATFELCQGEYVVCVGKNGSGKTTLARLLAHSLAPQKGKLVLDDVVLTTYSSHIGYVRQDPSAQIVSATVKDEIYFAMQNMHLDAQECKKRFEQMLRVCALETLATKQTNELSGGQQQRLAFAGVLAMYPKYLVLDEVCAQLDNGSAATMRKLITNLKEQGLGIFHVSHAVEDILSADKICLAENGKIIWTGTRSSFLASPNLLERADLLQQKPIDVMSKYNTIYSDSACDGPIDAQTLWNAASALYESQNYPQTLKSLDTKPHKASFQTAAQSPCLQVEHVFLSYDEQEVLQDISFSLKPSDVCVIAGACGSGKTTLLRLLAGLLKPDTGHILLNGKQVTPQHVGLSFQRPQDQLFCATVKEDILYTAKKSGFSSEQCQAILQDVSKCCDVSEALYAHSPFSLSGGQQRRVGIAANIASEKDIYLFDEPCAGLDFSARQNFHALVESLRQKGKIVCVVTHTIDEWLCEASYMLLLHDKHLVYAGNPYELIDDIQTLVQANLVPLSLSHVLRIFEKRCMKK